MPIRIHSLLRKLQRIGARSFAPLQSSASSALMAAPGKGRSTTSESTRSSIIPGLLIRISDKNWLVAHSSTYSLKLGGLKLNSSQRTALAPSDADTFSRLVNVMSGSGVRPTASSSRGAIAARKCRQRACDRNAKSSRAKAIRLW